MSSNCIIYIMINTYIFIREKAAQTINRQYKYKCLNVQRMINTVKYTQRLKKTEKRQTTQFDEEDETEIKIKTF